MIASVEIELRPGVTNPQLWLPERPPKSQWNAIRKIVLERDNHTCRYCGHRATRYMNVHHVDETGENEPENLITCCVACHAVLHIGRNMDLGIIQIWESEISQVEIVRRTRAGIANGRSLDEINSDFPLTEGDYPPDNPLYAADLAGSMEDEARAELPEPLCAVFVKLKRWQIESAT